MNRPRACQWRPGETLGEFCERWTEASRGKSPEAVAAAVWGMCLAAYDAGRLARRDK